MALNRRDFITHSALSLPLITSPFSFAKTAPASQHTVVLVVLTGGIDHSMFLPVFKKGTENTLTPAVHFAEERLFDFHNSSLINNPHILHPEHPLIKQFGDRLSIFDGIYMDGQNDHTSALAVMMRAGPNEGSPSFAAVLGELLGYNTEHGLVSFGRAPYHSSGGLSSYAAGVALPVSLLNVRSMIENDFALDDLTAEHQEELIKQFYNSIKSNPAKHPATLKNPTETLKRFYKFFTQVTPETQQALRDQFSLPKDLIGPYQEIKHPYGAERHEQFAVTAKMILKGGVAGCFLLSMGSLEGFTSYDTHGLLGETNDGKQPEMQHIDFKALAIFMDQIKSKLDNVTVIVQTEFGRSPFLNAAKGKEHWGFNNCFLMFSKLCRPGRYGVVNPEDYGPGNWKYSDGSSSQPLNCRGFYRAFTETLVERGITTAPLAARDTVLRQAFSGPVPQGLFRT